ncbi:membrane-bound lytic murein transglycosylase MltC [Candidatus Hartigia pinicola]
MKRLLVLTLLVPLLISCSRQQGFSLNYLKDTNSFNVLMGQFAHNIENIWGIKEVLVAGSEDYLKYTDAYRTRSHINFDAGIITIETISSIEPKKYLKKAIITTLLMSGNPNSIDLYSYTNATTHSKKPFLFEQVLDNNSQLIHWEGHAMKYADYLVNNKIQRRRSGMHIIWRVTMRLVPHHLDTRARKYLSYIKQASVKYGIDESLILAIMQTESSFNPYAVSRSNALGLMQIMQHTAGKDVFLSQGISGVPSRNYLFNPEKNIDMGTAYLAILQNNYLGDIQNQASRRYAVITAYNSGASRVLRIFHSDKKYAVKKINQLNSRQVYEMLLSKHPVSESRNYLVKVNKAQKHYLH